MSSVYRFHQPARTEQDPKPVLLRKRKPRPAPTPYLIAASEDSISDASGTRPIDAYRDLTAGSIYTLTRREADLIALANPGVRPPAALEDIHPWLPRRSFVNDSAIGYDVITSVVRRYGKHFAHATPFCDRKWNTICNSVRRKNGFDARFHAAWHLPIQDAFVLEERRPDRSVVAIDVNAMYPTCMQHPFPKPSALRRVEFDRMFRPAEVLPLGLYRCCLIGPASDFVRLHNPFRTFFCGRRLLASLSEPIQVDLNEFEIAYFARHFRDIYLADAVIADEAILHPLAKEIRRSFARRAAYQAQGNKALADREKYLATLMSSCANRPDQADFAFNDRAEALEHLLQVYGVSRHSDEPPSATDGWLHRGKGIRMIPASASVVVGAPDISNGSACFLLGQRTVARGRVHLLELMERVLGAASGVRICYTNIDSVHFSLPTKHLDDMMHFLRREASNRMGSLKIEAVSRHGLWLEPGRYWLYSDRVEKFRNRGVGDRLNPFKDRAIHVADRRLGDLHVPIRRTIRMDRSMSDIRTLVAEHDDDGGIFRQQTIEIAKDTEFAEILAAIERNRLYSTARRASAFGALKARLDRPCPAATGQGPDSNFV